MRRSLLVSLMLSVAFLTACSASSETELAAKQEAEKRGFMVLSVSVSSSDPFSSDLVHLEVLFGRCPGVLTYEEGAVQLWTDIVIPGSAEVNRVQIDNPTVESLQGNQAFKSCFE